MASIIKRCDCDGWNKYQHSWIVGTALKAPVGR